MDLASDPILPSIIEDKKKVRKDMQSVLNYSIESLKKTKSETITEALLEQYSTIEGSRPSITFDAASFMSR